MIRTIDNQMMLNQTMEASKTVGSRINTQEQNRAHQTEREQERIANEQQNVTEAKAAERRRIQDDENRKNKKQDRLKVQAKSNAADEDEDAAADKKKLNTWNMGRSIDIDI